MKKILTYFFILLLALSAGLLVYKSIVIPQHAPFAALPTPTTQVPSPLSPTPPASLANMLIMTNTSTAISLLDASGKTVGSIAILHPIAASDGHMAGTPQKQLLYQNPTSGSYTLHVAPTTTTLVRIYLYDRSAAVLVKKFTIDKETSFSILFDRQNITSSTIRML